MITFLKWLLEAIEKAKAVTEPEPELFTEYLTTWQEMGADLDRAAVPAYDLFDLKYWYLSAADWVKVLTDARRDLPKYVPERFDCDNFAFAVMGRVATAREINSCGVAIGNSPGGYHAWNIVLTTDGLYFFEPQNGNFWPVTVDNGYKADRVIFG